MNTTTTKKYDRKRKLVHREFGEEMGGIFTEALGVIKIEQEVKNLKKENKELDKLSADEYKERYSDWTVYELKELRKAFYKEEYK